VLTVRFRSSGRIQDEPGASSALGLFIGTSLPSRLRVSHNRVLEIKTGAKRLMDLAS
jgi:hypothetical protein